MTSDNVYVRARDGALYRNPVIVIPEGFICFGGGERPEIVVWRVGDGLCPEDGARVLLHRTLSIWGVATQSMTSKPELERIRPGSEPEVWTPANSYLFDLSMRIPIPSMHDGIERYAGRLHESEELIDMPSHSLDVDLMNVPEYG